ncbi:MAG: hypothetical protein WBZ29_00415 [Methanocella sp.]
MKVMPGKYFFIILSFIAVILAIILAYAIVVTPAGMPGPKSMADNSTGLYAITPSEGSAGYVWVGFPNGSANLSETYATPTPIGSYSNFTIIHLNDTEWQSYNKTPKDDMPLSWWSFNQTPVDEPHTREAVIVYFRDNPSSMNAFSGSYNITPIFYKADIRMAVFETVVNQFPLVISNKTREVIEKLSQDPLVELAYRDTFLFLDRREPINTTASVTYPEEYDKKGWEYVPHQLMVGFWRIPPSIEEFSARCGGRPVNLTESDLEFKWVLFETEDMNGFIDRASQDPYVRYVELNGIIRADESLPGSYF